MGVESCTQMVRVTDPVTGTDTQITINDAFPALLIYNESSRETESVNVNGVIIDRIKSVTFKTNDDKVLVLNFKN